MLTMIGTNAEGQVGGAAGCVIASRLAQADPSLSILLIERGPNNLNDPAVVHPAMYLSNLAAGTGKLHLSAPRGKAQIGGRDLTTSAGTILGGGSSVNFMMYTRGQACDYDRWNTKGWDFQSLLPYFKKFESFQHKGAGFDENVHGYDGPIQISKGSWAPQRPADDFMLAAESTGKKEIVDLNDFKSCDGYARWFSYISPDGKRQDAAHRYLHPILASGNHTNLQLLLETNVSRILIDAKGRATGVECFQNSRDHGEAAPSEQLPTVIQARKLVVISAGSLATPSILERSGIGSRPLLEGLSIPVVAELPGVGENYQDHLFLPHVYQTSSKPDETLDALITSGFDITNKVAERDPTLGWNAVTHAGKIRPRDDEVAHFSPELQKLWEKKFAAEPSRPLVIHAALAGFLGNPADLPKPGEGEPARQYMTLAPILTYSESRGRIHITSRDVNEPADFDAGWFSHVGDVEVLTWAYKSQRDLYRRTNAFQAEFAAAHPAFAPSSAAAAISTPVVEGGFKSVAERKAVGSIDYSREDDEAIEKYIKQTATAAWHPMGTAKMAPKEDGGVVTERLSVHGTTGLKVADMSICPAGVGANTYNTALMIGEKAADLIIEDLGLRR